MRIKAFLSLPKPPKEGKKKEKAIKLKKRDQRRPERGTKKGPRVERDKGEICILFLLLVVEVQQQTTLKHKYVHKLR